MIILNSAVWVQFHNPKYYRRSLFFGRKSALNQWTTLIMIIITNVTQEKDLKKKKLNKKYGTGRAQNKQSKSRRRSNETGTLLSLTEVGVFQSWCDTGTQIKTPSASGKVTCLGHWPSRVVVKTCAKISIVLQLGYIMKTEYETTIMHMTTREKCDIKQRTDQSKISTNKGWWLDLQRAKLAKKRLSNKKSFILWDFPLSI